MQLHLFHDKIMNIAVRCPSPKAHNEDILKGKLLKERATYGQRSKLPKQVIMLIKKA